MDAPTHPSPTGPVTAEAARTIARLVADYCPASPPTGAWCVDGDRGAVLIRFWLDGSVHVLSTYSVRFDFSGPSPRLVVATVPTIVPPLSHVWSEALGCVVSVVPHADPIEVVFPPSAVV